MAVIDPLNVFEDPIVRHAWFPDADDVITRRRDDGVIELWPVYHDDVDEAMEYMNAEFPGGPAQLETEEGDETFPLERILADLEARRAQQ